MMLLLEKRNIDLEVKAFNPNVWIESGAGIDARLEFMRALNRDVYEVGYEPIAQGVLDEEAGKKVSLYVKPTEATRRVYVDCGRVPTFYFVDAVID